MCKKLEVIKYLLLAKVELEHFIDLTSVLKEEYENKFPDLLKLLKYFMQKKLEVESLNTKYKIIVNSFYFYKSNQEKKRLTRDI